MSNRQFSSASRKKKHKERPHPLRDLNDVAINASSSSSSSSASSVSSFMSIEAPRARGCLRFFLSNSSSASKIPPHPHRRRRAGTSLPKATATKPKSAPLNAGNHPKLPSSCSSFSRSNNTNKPLKENLPKPTSQKPPCLYQSQYGGKKVTSNPAPTAKPLSVGLTIHSASGSQRQQQQCSLTTMDGISVEPSSPLNLPGLSTVADNSTFTTLASCDSALGCEFGDNLVEEVSTTAIPAAAAAASTTTPPAQASVSPEIQGGSSILLSSAATPACYGAGHIVSGVNDRRKCRARGILTVGKFNSGCGKENIFDNGDDVEILSKSRTSLVPLPAEASMRWLCDENPKIDPGNGLSNCIKKSLGSVTQHSLPSPSSGHGISSGVGDVFEYSNITSSSASSRGRTRITLLSPGGNPASRGLSGASFNEMAGCSMPVSPHATPTSDAQKHREHRYRLSGKSPLFSFGSLDSDNVIRTPQSDVTSGGRVILSSSDAHDHQKHDFGSEIDSLVKVLLRASLSPQSHLSIWDTPGSGFQLPSLNLPSNSIDLPKFPGAWDHSTSCISSSTFEEMSRSQVRVSWRDGLASRIFEMDEFDCCRYFSDDENNPNECSNGNFKASPNHELALKSGTILNFSNGFCSPETVGHEKTYDGELKEKFPPQRSNLCAESICIDGGLVASGDSDWTLCYKNQLFEL
ncbi:uncharacterized protein LOC127811609 [Diospyros lotus]|uniref:uncharacterized protein LOC127811609 n=1 Tax=Diospyros lotus TaxID=55363 RepID=UPI00225162C0|nr:uncharacterized protein LOC127811609 [Diospyros lotus]